VIECIRLVLFGCVVSFEDRYYDAKDGIPTGIAVAVILANMYLCFFDKFLLDSFGDQIQFLCRLVDDLLLLTSVDSNVIVTTANSWNEGVQLELTGMGIVNFLDETYSIQEHSRRLHWELYLKPQNLCLYLPATSNHPLSVAKSLIIGGAIRCNRRNRLRQDELRHLGLFKERLRERGYSLKFIDKVLQRYTDRRAAQQQHGVSSRKVFLKMKFNKDINIGWLKQKLAKHAAVLDSALPGHAACVSWSIHRSLFRLNYPFTWSRHR